MVSSVGVWACCCGTLPASSLPHFEGELCHGCNRALSPDATPLNCGDSMPSGAALMHTYACHQCDPSSARFVATSTLRPTQSFTVDSDVVVVARLSVDRAPLDTTQVGKDGGNTGALPSIDRVGRGLASQGLSTSRVIPERPKSFLHCTTPSALIGGLEKPRRQPAILTCVVTGAHVMQFWSPILLCSVDMQF